MTKLRSISTLFVCLIFALSSFGQSKIAITQEEFTAATKAAMERTNVFPRRHLVTEKMYSGDRVTRTYNLVWEAVSDERQRSVETEKIGDKVVTLEKIRIGADVYKRENEGEWKKEEWRFEHGLTRQDVVPLLSCSEFWIEETTINNEKVRIFDTFSTYNSEKTGLIYEQQKFWIGATGLLLKEETTYASWVLPKNGEMRVRTLIFEYDSNIKIEAPVLTKPSEKN